MSRQTSRTCKARPQGVLTIAACAMFLVGCGGGGGGGGSSSPPTLAPTSTPTAAPASTLVGGTVSQIASDGYGPAAILVSYQFDAATTPLAGATVVIGPVLIVGATPPPTLPAGDVSVTTDANGRFSAAVAAHPIAPDPNQAGFVIPTNNITGFVPPATGYYVSAFGSGADGLSPGRPIPVHAFLGVSTSWTLRVTSPTLDEANALAQVNADRASNAGAGPLIFDEATEEAARLHARDEATVNYICHYDTKNVGPPSRYLQLGGIGFDDENLDGWISTAPPNPATPAQGFALAESGFLAEKAANGPHYANIMDPKHVWAGLAIVFAIGINVDQEFTTPPGAFVGAGTYPVTNVCPAGTTANSS